MPVLNESLRLPGAIAQFSDCLTDLVVVDGGSTDRSVIVALAAGAEVISSVRGRAQQMNAGAKRLGSADILLFVHADVRLPHDWRHAIAVALARGARWGRLDVTLDSPHPLLILVGAMMNLRSRLTGIATGDQAIFMTHEAWHRVGGWPEIPLMEDIRMSRQLRDTFGHPVCLRERVLVSARRWEQRGIVRTILMMWGLRTLHALGVSPSVLHRLYYGRSLGAAASVVPCRIVVLTKVPKKGEVKTRLAATHGTEVALDTHRKLLMHTLVQVARVPGAVRELCVAGEDSEGECEALAQRFGFELTHQQGTDLGERMARAMQPGILRGERVVLVGTDCPVLDASDIADALRELRDIDSASVVFSPTEDGGYCLVGAIGAVPPIFEGMRWSHPEVMAETAVRLDAAAIGYRLLRTLWDVDDAAGWARWRAL